MTIEHIVVGIYLLACIIIGVLASRRVLGSRDEYWVAGRKIGTWINAVAIMAALASGGSIIGVMGLAYGRGIPFTLAMFAGAVIGFPLASILVAKPLRNFGKFTITDFLVFRYPNFFMRLLVPLLIVVSFTVYIVAQMKAAGITAETLLGIEYNTAVTIAAVVFILYVSVGGMLAITWTDFVQGILMIAVVVGAAAALLASSGSPVTIIAQATHASPELGEVFNLPQTSYIGAFLLWAAAIPIIPHIVMRVFTAKDAQGARLSLNIAMIFYSIMILAAVLIIVPVGKLYFPHLTDADTIFLRVMESEFSPIIRGLAVAAVMAAVMSTTDALLLACSSAITHDLLGHWIEKNVDPKKANWITIGIVWIIGLFAMVLAYSPPKLLTEFYSAAIGLLSAGLFVPTIAGLWWKKANTTGGLAALLSGTLVYLYAHFLTNAPLFSAILFALPVSVVAMWIGSNSGNPSEPAIEEKLKEMHQIEA